MALLYVDLDGFKAINDTWGHDAGDIVLKEVAVRLQSCVRQMDTAARIGGDEFLVILAELQCSEDAAAMAQKIIDALSLPFSPGSVEVSLSASVGIALSPANGDDPALLIKAADSAMYRVKKSGKNGWSFAHSPEEPDTI